MQTLEERAKDLNHEFCHDAERLRFQNKDGVWFNDEHLKAHQADPKYISIYRSVKSNGRSRYVYVIDLDGDKEHYSAMVEAAKLIQAALRNYFDLDAYIKTTGANGLHIFAFVEFGMFWKDDRCLCTMADMTTTIWTLLRLKENYDIDIGKRKPKPYIDMCMYEQNRMVRAFSKRFETGRYPDLFDKSALAPIWKYKRPAHMPMYKWKDIMPKRTCNMETAESRESRPITKSELMEKLPDGLRFLVDFEGDPPHELKWGLVCWLTAKTDMNANDMTTWVWENCMWDDLDNYNKTKYQVRWTYNWAVSIHKREGRWPLPSWVHDEKWVRGIVEVEAPPRASA